MLLVFICGQYSIFLKKGMKKCKIMSNIPLFYYFYDAVWVKSYLLDPRYVVPHAHDFSVVQGAFFMRFSIGHQKREAVATTISY